MAHWCSSSSAAALATLSERSIRVRIATRDISRAPRAHRDRGRLNASHKLALMPDPSTRAPTARLERADTGRNQAETRNSKRDGACRARRSRCLRALESHFRVCVTNPTALRVWTLSLVPAGVSILIMIVTRSIRHWARPCALRISF